MTEFLDYLGANPLALCLYVGLLGAAVGSFLNVVIHRLPRIMERQYQHDCVEFLHESMPELPLPEAGSLHSEPYTLSVPHSHCPQCKTPIKPWQNIPILSYLWQRGRCAQCQCSISIRYPLIELLTAAISVFVAWHVGLSWQLPAALVFSWVLIALTAIDFETKLLPDDLTLPLMWLGLLISTQAVFVSMEEAIIGAAAGYLSLWSVYQVFKLLTGKEGMGYGDFKLLAALGAWLGWQMLPVIIMLASAVGAVVGIALMTSKRLSQGQSIPFGPYLAAAGWLAMFYGEQINAAYWRFALG